jgi:hypothetical protein
MFFEGLEEKIKKLFPTKQREKRTETILAIAGLS